MSRRRLIVDGYNVLYAHPAYGRIASTDPDSARASLVADLAGYATAGSRVTVVFDGGGNPSSDGTPHHIGSLVVVFSPAGTTADTVIEALAHRSRARGEDVLVVTSDVATRETVRSGTVAVRSSQAFVAELTEAVDEIRSSGVGSRRTTVAERIDPAISSVLARWARGERPASD
ncbi:MAG: NYN domain-containing protein [Coriobacteriia bacterium]|nr:NYN domain-containing protein [Coriobacteriia bacterium]